MNRQQGIICSLVGDKKFGFIRRRDGVQLFFHASQVDKPWRSLQTGDQVEFSEEEHDNKLRAVSITVKFQAGRPGQGSISRTRVRNSGRVIGPYSGQTLDLNDEQRKQALTDISKWKLEARLDDIRRYFFSIPELNHIITGDASYVIGRKGTGKTALVQYLSENGDNNDTLAIKLTFKNFPFNELYGQTNDSYTRPNQYITIWKLIIYSAACRLLSQSPYVDALTKQVIEKAFPPPQSDNLGTIVGKWISGDFGINILGNGINSGGWFRDKKAFTPQQKVENLEKFVKKHMPNQTLLVLFDELDEDYKEIFENYNKSDYLDLLTSLFKAVQDVKSVFKGEKTRLYPVIFLRDDIYDLIQDADKNKWRDLEVDLDWTDEGIRGLIAHRLSKVMGSSSEDFNELWYSIFEKRAIQYSRGNKEIASFDFIKMSAQGRPRDYINYLQECSSIELKRSAREITVETIKDADKAYSNYLKKELIDEIHGIIPDISKVLAIFSESRKWILSIEEFKAAYNERLESKTLSIPDSDMVLRTLFYFSVIGNVVRVDLHIFRHERPDAQLNFKEKIVVHRGLMKSLQIV